MSYLDEDKHVQSLNSSHSSESGVSDDTAMRKINLKKCLYVCSFAFMMNYSAYGGLVFLQSSMNIEEGLGMASLFAIYATSSLSTILLIPFLIDFLGAKAAILLGEVGIIAFTLANFYPNWFLMMPVAVLHGLTESASWSGAAVYVTRLGEHYWHQKRQSSSLKTVKKTQEDYVCRFISVFYIFVYMAQVVGNALVYAVLYGMKGSNGGSLAPLYDNLTDSYEVTTMSVSADHLSRCGAEECQSELTNEREAEELKKYKPDQMSIYLLLTIFFLVQVAFTLVHAFAMPRIPAKFQFKLEEKKSMMSSRDDEEPVLKRVNVKIPSRCCAGFAMTAVFSELKETFRHMVSPLNLLVFPVMFYEGVFIAFNVTEFTRAYVSCTIGVEKVGLAMMTYGMSSMFVCLLCTKMLPLLGRNAIMFFVFVMHMSIYALCLLWTPTASNWWHVYVMAAILGACDGIFANVIQALVAVYFQDKLAIAFSVKNLSVNLGIVAGTGVSTLLCIYVKIYWLMGLLTLSCVTYVGAECVYRRKRRTQKGSNNNAMDF